MNRIRHSPEQMIRKLREADAGLAKRAAVRETSKALGIAGNTYTGETNSAGSRPTR